MDNGAVTLDSSLELASPEEKDAGLELLKQELQNRAMQNQMVAETKVATSNLKSNAQQVENEASWSTSQRYQDALAWASQAPQVPRTDRPIITMESLYKNEFARLPKDSQIISTITPPGAKGSLKSYVDDKTGETILTAPPRPITPPQDNVTAANDIYNRTSGPNPAATANFDLGKSLRDLNSLNGSEKGIATLQLIGNIEAEIARRTNQIKIQATNESGLHEADAEVALLSQTAKLRGMNPSNVAQVLNAQAVQQQALAAISTRVATIATGDQELARLNSAKTALTVYLQKTMTQGEREESIVELVDKEQVINHNILTGTTGDGFKDKLQLSKMKEQDPEYKLLMGFNSDTAPALLASPNPSTAAKALRLLVERDKLIPSNRGNGLNGKGIPANADRTFVSNEVEKLLRTNPEALIKQYYTGKDDPTLKNYQSASPTEKRKMELGIKALLIPTAIENAYTDGYREATNWVGTQVLPTSPLGKVIERIKAANKGKANMLDVVDAFIKDESVKIPNAAGTAVIPLPFKDKIAILHSAINDTSSAEFKSVLVTDPSAINSKLREEIMNQAIRTKTIMAITSFGFDPTGTDNRMGTSISPGGQ